MTIDWRGQGVDEKGYDANDRCIVAVDPRYYRPTEVDTLMGDATKALHKLGWRAKVSFEALIAEMVHEDLRSAERYDLVKRHGFIAHDYRD
jgi:GDPmannose 4,6-dehydratase